MTEKPTEFGLGKTDFCRNCQCFALHSVGDPVQAGDCRANPPTHDGFPMTYAEKWCMRHHLTVEESEKRLHQIAKKCSDDLRASGLFTIIPPVNAGKSEQTRCDTLSDGVNTWEHYPDVDGL